MAKVPFFQSRANAARAFAYRNYYDGRDRPAVLAARAKVGLEPLASAKLVSVVVCDFGEAAQW
jgi:hypothetical protein